MATATQSICEIVTAHPSAAPILERFEINFDSHANQSLTEACAALQLSVDQVLEKLAAAELGETGVPTLDPASMPLQKLIQHIVRLHHRTVRQQLPRLAAEAHKLAIADGARTPDLFQIDRLMDELQGDIIAHIETEENALFPYIAYLDQPPGVTAPSGKSFRRVSQPVRMMMNDHDSALKILGELSRITNGFRAPASACATHVSLYADLRAFQDDLNRHIQLEDGFLFPRAVKLEDQVASRAQS